MVVNLFIKYIYFCKILLLQNEHPFPSYFVSSFLHSNLLFFHSLRQWGENTGVQSDFRHPSRSSINSAYSQVWLTACGLNKGWVLLTSRWCIWNWSSEAERVTDLWPLIVAMSDSPVLSFVVSERRERPFKSGTAEVWRLHWHIYLHTPAADSLANEANGRHMM